MSDEKYPIVKRIFLAQPRRRDYPKGTWLARPVFNEELTKDERLTRPAIYGYSHDDYELYLHVSVVKELRAQVDQLESVVRHDIDKIEAQYKARVAELEAAMVTIECGLVTTEETAQFAGLKPKDIAKIMLRKSAELKPEDVAKLVLRKSEDMGK